MIFLGVLKPDPCLHGDWQDVRVQRSGQALCNWALSQRQYNAAHWHCQRLQARLQAAIAQVEQGPGVQALRLLLACKACIVSEKQDTIDIASIGQGLMQAWRQTAIVQLTWTWSPSGVPSLFLRRHRGHSWTCIRHQTSRLQGTPNP